MEAKKLMKDAGIEDDPLWLKDKGNEFFRSGNIASAKNAFTAAAELDPSNPSLYSNRAVSPGATWVHRQRPHRRCGAGMPHGRQGLPGGGHRLWQSHFAADAAGRGERTVPSNRPLAPCRRARSAWRRCWRCASTAAPEPAATTADPACPTAALADLGEAIKLDPTNESIQQDIVKLEELAKRGAVGEPPAPAPEQVMSVNPDA